MKQWAILSAFVSAFALAVPQPVLAQQTPPAGSSRTDLGGKEGNQTFSVRGHIILWGAGGLDLDVLGNVTGGALGTIRGTQMLIDVTAYPDVYVRTQRRRSAGIGFGVLKSVELFARYEDTNNPASAVVIGKFGSDTNTFGVAFDNYKDRLIEFGLRKYLASPKRSRVYIALSGGMKTVEPISMTMQVPGGNVRTELYSKSRIPSYGVGFGVTLEYRHFGFFVDSGFRYQKRLMRNDSDLALYGLEDVNNTGVRFFMPATLGLLVRF